MHTYYTTFTITIIFLLAGCQSGEQIVEKTGPGQPQKNTSPDGAPDWFSSTKPFSVDSTTVFASSLALNSDSINAINMARKMALANLQYGLSNVLEEQRQTLYKNTANEALNNPAFILSLRKAEESIISKASFKSVELRQKDGNHFCYAGVTLSNKVLAESLQSYFSGNEKYKRLIEGFSF